MSAPYDYDEQGNVVDAETQRRRAELRKQLAWQTIALGVGMFAFAIALWALVIYGGTLIVKAAWS